MRPDNIVLRLAGFQKFYGNSLALSVGSLELEPGIYWVKGANGSGKSTFLKTVAGMLSYGGEIVLDEATDLKKNPVAYRKQVNFGEAEPLFPSFVTGSELINVFIAAKGASFFDVPELAAQMGMERFLPDPTGTYSSGMLKKLSLLLAFIGSPRIILLDEPLITLDIASLEVLYHWIREGHKRGVTFLITSHQEPDQLLISGLTVLLVEDQTIKRMN